MYKTISLPVGAWPDLGGTGGVWRMMVSLQDDRRTVTSSSRIRRGAWKKRSLNFRKKCLNGPSASWEVKVRSPSPEPYRRTDTTGSGRWWWPAAGWWSPSSQSEWAFSRHRAGHWRTDSLLRRKEEKRIRISDSQSSFEVFQSWGQRSHLSLMWSAWCCPHWAERKSPAGSSGLGLRCPLGDK